MNMRECSISFAYNTKGRGLLLLFSGEDVVMDCYCRTGSIDPAGALVNACPPKVYTIESKSPPIDTDHPAMHVIDGLGWWCVFYDSDGNKTHLGLHPDGGAGGTLGCIAMIGTDARPLKDRITEILKTQKSIKVYISKGA